MEVNGTVHNADIKYDILSHFRFINVRMEIRNLKKESKIQMCSRLFIKRNQVLRPIGNSVTHVCDYKLKLEVKSNINTLYSYSKVDFSFDKLIF